MNQLNIFTVFMGGVLSFFAPCVLPLIPLYLAHLTNNSAKFDEHENLIYTNNAIVVHTIAFIFGLLSVFFIMAIGIEIISPFIIKYRDIIAICGGIILLLMSVNQLGWIKIPLFNQTHQHQLNKNKGGVVKSFLMGFFFSFSWSPCISPMLTTVVTYSLINNDISSGLYILIYALGFVLPFVIVAIFGKTLLTLANKNKDKIHSIFETASYVLLVIALFMIFTGGKNIYSQYKAKQALSNQLSTTAENTNQTNSKDVKSPENSPKERILALDFDLIDQDGNHVRLEDFKDKYLMMTFVASWCQYCGAQIETSKEYLANHQDLEIVFVMADSVNNDGTDISEYAKQKGIRVLKDDGSLFREYGIYAYPNSVFIGPDSTFIGKVPGSLQSQEQLIEIFKKVQKHYNS